MPSLLEILNILGANYHFFVLWGKIIIPYHNFPIIYKQTWLKNFVVFMLIKKRKKEVVIFAVF